MATVRDGNFITKGNIKFYRIDIGTVSGADVVQYLQNQLAIPIGSRFTRYDGPMNVNRFAESMQPRNGIGIPSRPRNSFSEYSYVRLDIALRPSDILEAINTKDIIDRILAESGSGYRFQKHFRDTIAQFQYPKNLTNIILNSAETFQRLSKRGVTRDLLEKIEAIRTPIYSQNHDVFYMSVDIEQIIKKMMEDPMENKVQGKWCIVAVRGETQNDLEFCIRAARDNVTEALPGISWNTIFDDLH